MSLRRTVGVMVGCAAMAVLSGCSLLTNLGDSPRDADKSITASAAIEATSLRAGDCLVSTELSDSFTEVPGVPCTQAHDAEITYLFDMPDGDYSQEDMSAAAEQECATAAETYLGPNWQTVNGGDIDTNWFYPSSESWTAGDREITCLVYTPSGDLSLTDTVRGAGQ
ncbi:MAG: septum formation family protein [Propionibacteriaceae bacterium]|jgi:hypothetical protein|nr:septum formation family protein [Propionibacteriaceae bacterium]